MKWNYASFEHYPHVYLQSAQVVLYERRECAKKSWKEGNGGEVVGMGKGEGKGESGEGEKEEWGE